MEAARHAPREYHPSDRARPARLDEGIARANVPPSRLDETITIATWNIRELGRRPRLKASLDYIAEIIGQFDLVISAPRVRGSACAAPRRRRRRRPGAAFESRRTCNRSSLPRGVD